MQLVPFGPADGSQLLTNDYVWHEVLAAGDPDVVDTLLQISVVDRVNAGLAGAITGNPDAGSLLLRGEETACSSTASDQMGGSACTRSSRGVAEQTRLTVDARAVPRT